MLKEEKLSRASIGSRTAPHCSKWGWIWGQFKWVSHHLKIPLYVLISTALISCGFLGHELAALSFRSLVSQAQCMP